MQRIANLLIEKDGYVLLLKKPRRGWYVAPGGKVDAGESIYEAAMREFHEETGARAIDPILKGTYTMVIMDEQISHVKDEWMLFTFVARNYEGIPFEENREGKLEWHPVEALHHLPMAEGDRTNLLFALHQKGIQFGTFTYTEQFKLLKERLQHAKGESYE